MGKRAIVLAGGEFVISEFTPVESLKKRAEHRCEKKREENAHQGTEERWHAIDFVCRRAVFLFLVGFGH